MSVDAPVNWDALASLLGPDASRYAFIYQASYCVGAIVSLYLSGHAIACLVATLRGEDVATRHRVGVAALMALVWIHVMGSGWLLFTFAVSRFGRLDVLYIRCVAQP